MLIVRYELSDGTLGEDVVLAGQKWIFGRPGGDEEPTVGVDDRRVSRASLVIRDSGPGPVVFRGQRGDTATVALRAADGSVSWLDEEHVITLEVEFADRPSIVERQREDLVDETADLPVAE